MGDDTAVPDCVDSTDCYVRWQEWNWERDLCLDRALVAESALAGERVRSRRLAVLAMLGFTYGIGCLVAALVVR